MNLNKKLLSITEREEFNRIKFLKSQIKSASSSVMSNIAEGFGRCSNKEFCHFLFYAHGSLNEVKSQLFNILDEKIITDEEFNELYNEADEISKKILGFVKYLRTKQ